MHGQPNASEFLFKQKQTDCSIVLWSDVERVIDNSPKISFSLSHTSTYQTGHNEIAHQKVKLTKKDSYVKLKKIFEDLTRSSQRKTLENKSLH